MAKLAASPALRKAYVDLSEDLKRRFWQVWHHDEQDSVRNLVQGLGLHGGFRIERVLDRKIPLHRTKLDSRLIEPPIGRSDFLPLAARAFLVKEREGWVDEINKSLSGATKHDVVEQLKRELDSLEARCHTDPCWPLFRARAELTPEGWLPDQPADSPPGPSKPDDDLAMPNCEADEFSEISAICAELEKSLSQARVAQSFPLERSLQQLSDLAVRGQRVRDEIERLARTQGAAPASWTSIEEAREITRKLRKDTESLNAAKCSARLKGVAEALGSISAFKVNSLARREKLRETRLVAIAEIERLALQTNPCELPFSGEGREWLKNLYGLRDAEMDGALDSLRNLGLASLATVIESTSWEIVEFQVAHEKRLELSPTSTEATGAVADPSKTSLISGPTEPIAPPEKEQAQPEHQALILGQSATVTTPAHIEPSPNLEIRDAEGDVASGATPLAVNITPSAVVTNAAKSDHKPDGEALLVVAHLLATDRPSLAADFVDTLPKHSGMPPAEMLRLLSLQPQGQQPQLQLLVIKLTTGELCDKRSQLGDTGHVCLGKGLKLRVEAHPLP